MLPPFSKVSGSPPFSKGHVSFLAPFFKGFWKCSVFQRVMSAFWRPFSKVSGSASFSKGHVSFLAPFFQGFWKCFLFQGSCQLFAPFLKGFWMCFLFQGSCQFLQKFPFFKGLLLLGFPKFPFPRSVFKVSPWPFFQRLINVCTSVPFFQRCVSTMLPFSKVKVSFKPSCL